MSPRRRSLWLAGHALVTFLAFPQPFAGRVLDLGIALAWLSPALLLLGSQGLAPRRAGGFGFLAGLAAHAAILHWIYVVTVTYGHAPPIAGVLAPVALAAYIAAFPAGFCALFAWLDRRGLASPVAAAALWTALDHLRSFALSGFPWATLGYAQHRNAALLAFVPYTGVYGLCFASALGGAALARLARPARSGARARAAAWGALAALAAAHAVGAWLARAPEPESEARGVRVAVLQGNIDQGVKWSPAFAAETLAAYEELSRRAAAEGARVIVWPETAVPGSFELDPGLRGRVADLARELDASLVVGAVGIEVAEGRPTRFYDSAYLVDPGHGFRDRYDKAHLVPFGEYVPLRDWLGLAARAVARGIATSDVSAGDGPRPLASRLRDGAGGTLTAAAPICYELLFPGLVRRFVRDGAELLLAITNDAWYGRTGAPYQFLAITAVRSAETRVWTARAANTGVSAFIDARGRVRARTPIFERALLVHDVPLRPAPLGGSFYTRHGDVFAGACWLALAGWVGVGALRRPRAGDAR